jgi:hypothetical protein
LILIVGVVCITAGFTGLPRSSVAVATSAPSTSSVTQAMLPVFRLSHETASPQTALTLASRLEGIGGQQARTEQTYAATQRFDVFSERATGAAVPVFEQFAASFGFVASDPAQAFAQKARGPFNLTNARYLACYFLLVNELFPEETLPAAQSCDDPAKLPYTTSVAKLTNQSATPGSAPAAVQESAVIVRVPLALNVGTSAPSYIPLGGPGGHLSLLLTNTDLQSNATPSLDQQVPGLAALAMPWFGRSYQNTKIGDFPAVAQDEAIRQLRESVRGGTIDPGTPELVYYVGDAAVEQSVLMPVWTFPHATATVDGQVVNLREMMLPGVQGFLPSVTITSPSNRAQFRPGQWLTFNATIGGGVGPFAYEWLLEDGTVLGSGMDFRERALTFSTRDIPALNRSGVPIGTLVRLRITDQHGATGEASVMLQPIVPVIYLPMTGKPAPTGSVAAAPISIAAPPYGVGVEWIQNYNEQPGLGNLGGTQPDADGFYNNLAAYGWNRSFRWYNNAAWEKDWRDCALGGGDCSYGVDRSSTDFAYFSGHGSPSRIYFGVNQSSVSFFGGEARYQNVRWVAFSSCQTISATSIGDWFNAFQGAHMLLGFHSNMADAAFGGPLADNMRMPRYFGADFPLLQRTIAEAWVQTAFNMNAGLPSYIYATSQSVNPSGNKLPRGGDPALPRPYPANRYYWVWWE